MLITSVALTGLYVCSSSYFFFFFQAEDGIRDLIVTGVQTCALPIYLRTDPGRKSGVGRHWNLGFWAFPGLARGVSRTVVVVRERDDRGGGPGHDTGRLFAFRRLAVQVGHRAGVARGQPAIELGGVGVRLERGDSHRVEAHLERSTLQLDGSARRLCVTLLLDAFVFHTCIVSRRHRAKLITSSTGGTACSSPYAVSMRQRVYSRGGSGRDGGGGGPAPAPKPPPPGPRGAGGGRVDGGRRRGRAARGAPQPRGAH